MDAYCLIRPQPHYRREAFEQGLKRAGYRLRFETPPYGRPGDVLVVWNRYGMYQDAACRFERSGGLVLVAENGYLGHDENGIQFYALACYGHNGSGWWPEGDGSRFAALGVEPKPWKTGGEFFYVRGQRGIGSPTMASPPNWHRNAAEKLRKAGHKVWVQEHPRLPANDPAQIKALQAALESAAGCVIWSSAAGVRALMEGVPVWYSAPHWICAGAARSGLEVSDPIRDDGARLNALERMAWAQWSVAEIASGEPFKLLVECNHKQRGPEEAVA